MERLIDSFCPMRGWPVAAIVILTQFIASYLVNLLPYSALRTIYPFLRPMRWERNGQIYQSLFHIRAWKDYIPAVGQFDKKNMKASLTPPYVSQYLLEGARAELCHLYAVVFAIVLLFMTVDSAHIKIMLWAFALNAPCIMIQRYNRPRFERFMNKDERGAIAFAEFWKAEIKEEGE